MIQTILKTLGLITRNKHRKELDETHRELAEKHTRAQRLEKIVRNIPEKIKSYENNAGYISLTGEEFEELREYYEARLEETREK